ncbi:MAG: dihydrolipoyllysine-residue acetyltransferase [candidate division KSB1 bacterium]|nr:dihydrolipoyllysine-residue acetyltransferase [candidate division KSB1 bacterium]
MIKEFRLPELGENITSGDIIQVLVSPGDSIEKDQPVLEIETDKATIEVPAPESGRVKDILVKPGDVAEVGQLVLTFEVNAESPTTEAGPVVAEAPEPTAEPVAGPQPAPAAATPVAEPPLAAPAPASAADAGKPMIREVRLPELGENIESGDVVKVHVQPGDTVEKDHVIMEIETDKATIEVPSPFAGRVKEVLVKEGDKAEIHQLLMTVETAESAEPVTAPATVPAAEAPAPPLAAPVSEPAPAPQERTQPGVAEPAPAPVAEPAPSPAASAGEFPPSVSKKLVPASPAVRRFAREIGIDISKVPGTGPGGRITIEDVKRYSRDLRRREAETRGAPAGAVFQPGPMPDFTRWGAVRKEPMSSVRRATAQRMGTAWNTIPHVTQFDKADITELEKLRKQFAPKAEAMGAKLTITAILLKVVAAALKVFPKFNASIDTAKNEIIFKDYYHIGVAVDTERGLLVPVIRDVDQKNIIQLAVEVAEAADRARNRKTSLEEMQGGTFTITNLGGIGGTNFTPIINWPEVAILGVSRGSYEPVFIDGQFQPRLMLPLSVSYDHRIIDGADAARFLRWIVTALEQPFMIALEG